MIDTSVRSTVSASAAALAWLNAFLAASNDGDRPPLYRSLSVEFFRRGVQFVGCDGTLLFRTWAPVDAAPMPLIEEVPDHSVIVVDDDKFILAFMRTLAAATKETPWEPLVLAIEPAPLTGGDMPLGEAFQSDLLTLSALGQQLHCKLYEGIYPDWRRLQYGVDRTELVDGMLLATRMFSTVGKLKGITRIACEFHGDDRQIAIHGTGDSEVRGLMMPMRRLDERVQHADEAPELTHV